MLRNRASSLSRKKTAMRWRCELKRVQVLHCEAPVKAVLRLIATHKKFPVQENL